MARSVILESTVRCERCRFTPRWCICGGYQAVASPLQVDVLIHRREFWRPTSTGRLINRVMPASRGHVFEREAPPRREAIVAPDRELWILHPRGEAMPSGVAPAAVQVLLLDGSWREAAAMLPVVERWGRKVRLPMTGPSRYWLRAQQEGEKYSTIEALMFLLDALGRPEEAAQLRLQFELHVYAGLRTRGAKVLADDFLATSPLPAALPELLRQLHESRPQV
jgi:DTW domain-containing protein YfiP